MVRRMWQKEFHKKIFASKRNPKFLYLRNGFCNCFKKCPKFMGAILNLLPPKSKGKWFVKCNLTSKQRNFKSENILQKDFQNGKVPNDRVTSMSRHRCHIKKCYKNTFVCCVSDKLKSFLFWFISKFFQHKRFKKI